MQATLENLKVGTVVASTPPHTIVAVASPVWPRGSQADRQQRANRQLGTIMLRVIFDDGTTSLWHNGNTICTIPAGA